MIGTLGIVVAIDAPQTVDKLGLDNGKTTRATIAIVVGTMRTTVAVGTIRVDGMTRVAVAGGKGGITTGESRAPEIKGMGCPR